MYPVPLIFEWEMNVFSNQYRYYSISECFLQQKIPSFDTFPYSGKIVAKKRDFFIYFTVSLLPHPIEVVLQDSVVNGVDQSVFVNVSRL